MYYKLTFYYIIKFTNINTYEIERLFNFKKVYIYF